MEGYKSGSGRRIFMGENARHYDAFRGIALPRIWEQGHFWKSASVLGHHGVRSVVLLGTVNSLHLVCSSLSLLRARVPRLRCFHRKSPLASTTLRWTHTPTAIARRRSCLHLPDLHKVILYPCRFPSLSESQSSPLIGTRPPPASCACARCCNHLSSLPAPFHTLPFC